ncbi:MAG: ABC transporter permease [Planctomycetota bacterium]|jgi:oligopeptide transport system permease protein
MERTAPIQTEERSRRRMLALATMVVTVLLLVSVGSLPFAASWYNVQSLTVGVRAAPSWSPVVPLDDFDRGRDPTVSPSPLTKIAHGLVSIMGHDDLGRSLFYRAMPALLISLLIGLAAAGVSVVIGVSWGAVAAYAGGRVDLVMMRIVDVLYSLPYVLMVILIRTALVRPLRAALGDSAAAADFIMLFIAIGAVSWLTMARVVRGQVLTLRERGFVEAARTAGAGPFHILRKHLLPNLLGPVFVCATMIIPQAILQESFLSFLGIGIRQPVPSLGRLAAEGVESVNMFVSYWWLLMFPCALLVVTLVALAMIGDALHGGRKAVL